MADVVLRDTWSRGKLDTEAMILGFWYRRDGGAPFGDSVLTDATSIISVETIEDVLEREPLFQVSFSC